MLPLRRGVDRAAAHCVNSSGGGVANAPIATCIGVDLVQHAGLIALAVVRYVMPRAEVCPMYAIARSMAASMRSVANVMHRAHMPTV